MKDFGISRDVPLQKGECALLFIDVQKYSAPGGGAYAHLSPAEVEAQCGYFFHEMRERAIACATRSAARQESALANNCGYCRQLSTDAILAELASFA